MAIKIRKTKKRSPFKKALVTAAMGLVAVALMIFLAVSNWRMYSDSQVVSAEIKDLEEQIRIADERRETLKAGLNAAQGEGFQEEKMRDQGYKKPGEEVIAVLQDKPLDANKQDGNSNGGFWMNFWEKIKNFK